MTAKTIPSILQHLDRFDEAWILSTLGSLNQTDRRWAIENARKCASKVLIASNPRLITRLQTINFELSNWPSHQDELRLKLTAYAIIHHMRAQWGNAATLQILALQCEWFTQVCSGGTVE